MMFCPQVDVDTVTGYINDPVDNTADKATIPYLIQFLKTVCVA
jgi:hypothetical protein